MNKRRSIEESRAKEAGSGGFPETQTFLLAAAAEGSWDDFLVVYLRPCWENVTAACRAKGLDLHEADELLQELVLRLIRPGRFAAATRRKGNSPDLSKFVGNLPARFLRYRELPLQSAKFRTYLKTVIAHLIAEAIRRRKRSPRQTSPEEEAQIVAWLDRSIDVSIERQRLADALNLAVEQLFHEAATARTRGRRRYFDFLYYNYVRQLSPGMIAVHYGVDRTTVSDAFGEAKKRLVEIMQKCLGTIADQRLEKWFASNSELISQTFAAYSRYFADESNPGGLAESPRSADAAKLRPRRSSKRSSS